jgi:hypothetical protein
MSNRSRGEALAVGAEPFHERCLFFGRGEGRLERIAREEDALVRSEAAFSKVASLVLMAAAWSSVR